MENMKQRRIQVWLPLLLGIVMALGMLAGFQLAGDSGRGGQQAGQNQRSSVQQVIDLLQYKYVDSVKVDSLEEAAIQRILLQVDPHTTYIPREELEEVNADLQGAFSGIGVEYQIIHDTVNVVYVVEKGPSEKAGLQAGDQIIKVFDKNIAGVGLSGTALRQLLRGAARSQVEITYLRNGAEQKAMITRGNIPLPSVDAFYMINKQVGYIRLNRFAETTYREFMDAATTLQGQGMQKMVLDLRGNSGGLMEAATYIADELLEDGLTIVSTRGLHIKSKTTSSTKPGIFEKEPVVVLIDEFSASASEVLAGALQDNDRGTIVGRRSFGKGLVQEQYDLSNGGALRITVARYFTPTGRSIQKPYNGSREEYLDEVIGRHIRKDSLAKSGDSTKVYTTRKGKKLPGGGGIYPDVEVPLDSTRIPRAALPLFSGNLLGDFSFQLFREHQQAIRRFPSLESYQSGFTLPANTWQRYLQAAAADSIQVPASLPPQVEADILLRIKANMARYVWRTTGVLRILHANDKALQQALLVLQKP